MSLRRVTDALGRSVLVPEVPERIVSLVPSLTEWLFALGLGGRVVGVTDYCVQPSTGSAGEMLREKPRLRGTKNPNRRLIRALQPDIVLANKEENRERDVTALAEAGLAVYVTDPRTVAEAIEMLGVIAELLGAKAAAAPFLAEMQSVSRRVVMAPARSMPRLLVPIWRDPWMAIGGDTYAHDLLRTCGGVNVGAALSGHYPRFDPADLAQLQPDLVLLPSEPYAFGENDLSALRPFFEGPIHLVDGELLFWYGPRLPIALHTFSTLLI